MAMNRASFAKMLEPGLNTLFGLEYDSYPAEYEAVFESNTSQKAFEEDVLLSGFGNAPTKGEGAAISYDAASQQWTARYQHETIALAFSITEEAEEDGQYGAIASASASNLNKGATGPKISSLATRIAVVTSELPRPPITEGFHGVAQIEVGLAVALAFEGEHRVGTALDFAVGHAREMHPKERKVGVGHGVDQVADLVLGVVFELVVIAPESHDAFLQRNAVPTGKAVGLQARTNHNLVCVVSFGLARDLGADD